MVSSCSTRKMALASLFLVGVLFVQFQDSIISKVGQRGLNVTRVPRITNRTSSTWQVLSDDQLNVTRAPSIANRSSSTWQVLSDDQLNVTGAPRISNRTSSTWQVLSDDQLPTYFNPYELAGLENHTCGRITNMEDPWRWLGTTSKEPQPILGRGSHASGPCCPNGHTYGWFGAPLTDTTPLKMVEVTSEGEMVPPFQIQSLLQAIQQQKQNENATRTKTINIWILGDSTSTQLFYGVFCALARIGAHVDQCSISKESSGHYAHPACNRTGSNYQHSLDDTTSANVTHSSVKFHYNNDDDPPLRVQIPGGRIQLELHHFHDQKFSHMTRKQGKQCRAHDQRFLNLARSLPGPDLFLINLGLHRNPDQLKNTIQQLLNLLQPEYASQLVWRETTVTHFPDSQQTGLYEKYAEELVDNPINDSNNSKAALTCADLIDETYSQPRIAAIREILASIAPNLPQLRLQETEHHLWRTYGLMSPKETHLDCVHHVYTPLYYDSLLWRLTKIVENRNKEETTVAGTPTTESKEAS